MRDEFEPCGVITITTDFGHQGPFVATMKGQMLTRMPQVRIIDVTHEVPVYWPAEAGFWLSRAFAYFPHGTVHVAVVDPGVGTNRDIIAILADGHAFLAPDNGLLAPLVGRAKRSLMHRVDVEAVRARIGLAVPSATFHGRDIFAPIAAEMAAGRIRLSQLGPEIHDIVPAWVDEPTIAEDHVSGVIITIDHFGNLITNIDASLISQPDHCVVRAGGHEFSLRRTYGDVRPGDYLALINSFGVLEVARAEQSAADGLGLGRGAPVVVSRR